MGKIVDPTVVFRTPSAEEVEKALAVLQHAQFPTALQSALEDDVLIEDGDQEVSEGLSHTLLTSAELAETAAAALRSGGFAADVEPRERSPRRRGDALASLILWGLAAAMVVWLTAVFLR